MAHVLVLVRALALLAGVAPAGPTDTWCGKNPKAPVVVDTDTCTVEGLTFRVSLTSPTGCWPEDDMTVVFERDGMKVEARGPGPRATRWWMLDLVDPANRSGTRWKRAVVCKRIDTVHAGPGRVLVLLRASGRPGADRLVAALYDITRNAVLDLKDIGAVGELVDRSNRELWFRDGEFGETTGELIRKPADEVKLPDGDRIVSAQGEFMPLRPVVRVWAGTDEVLTERDLQRTYVYFNDFFNGPKAFGDAIFWGTGEMRTMVRHGRTATGRACVQPHRGEPEDAWRSLPWYCERRPCREHPEVRPPCFEVQGRLSYWNGTPTARIWIVGTNRMLGVSDGHALPTFEQMPKDVRARMNWDTDLFGNYTFCPFTPEQPGVMQLGCIQAADGLRAEKRSK